MITCRKLGTRPRRHWVLNIRSLFMGPGAVLHIAGVKKNKLPSLHSSSLQDSGEGRHTDK